jgi:hypothetical protein
MRRRRPYMLALVHVECAQLQSLLPSFSIEPRRKPGLKQREQKRHWPGRRGLVLCRKRGTAKHCVRDGCARWRNFEPMQAECALSLFDSCDVRRMQEAFPGRMSASSGSTSGVPGAGRGCSGEGRAKCQHIAHRWHATPAGASTNPRDSACPPPAKPSPCSDTRHRADDDGDHDTGCSL